MQEHLASRRSNSSRMFERPKGKRTKREVKLMRNWQDGILLAFTLKVAAVPQLALTGGNSRSFFGRDGVLETNNCCCSLHYCFAYYAMTNPQNQRG
mmetsp:Transcript_23091/g.33079  ORF Transcript_23091/g.33079 Transcript_23091/m.33079 type:complete len:96 (+) Transcript_23091:1156-1443(+)